jgi:hypothetical protein
MTVAQLIAQLRHLVLEHPEASNAPVQVQGHPYSTGVVVHIIDERVFICPSLQEDADGPRS